MRPIDWIIFVLGCAATVVVVLQRRAIRRRDTAKAEQLGGALLGLSALEAEARASREQGIKRES